MFYIFIIFLAIATIVVYGLQKKHEKNHPWEMEQGEKTAHVDTGEAQQMDNQDERPIIPQTMTPQGISLVEQQADISTARHLITKADSTETHQDDTPTDRELTSKDTSRVKRQETTPTSRKLTPKEIVAICVGVLLMLIVMTLMEMDHPLGPVLIGILVLGHLIWFIRMPQEKRTEMKAQWTEIKTRIQAAEQRKAQSPFRTVMKVIAVGLLLLVIIIIIIMNYWKFL